MAVIKDLGAVTAYAAAVEGGYTGTKAEFETLMASYATVAEEAAESAESASQSAESASASASTATSKASEATTAAQTATAKAEETQADADAAALDASQALSAASTATTKASEAAQSAIDAATAKTAAQTAQTAAEGSATTAQTAAQTATTKAAEAAESARTLTIDPTLTQSGQAADSKIVGDEIDRAKSDVNKNSILAQVDFATYAGYLTSSGYIGAQDDTALELYTEKIEVQEGDRITFLENLSEEKSMWVAYGAYNTGGEFIERVIIKPSGTAQHFIDTITIGSGIGYIVFSYRTYGIDETYIYHFTGVQKKYASKKELTNAVELLTVYGLKSPLFVPNKTRFIMHRGLSNQAPENTLPAFTLAGRAGAWGIETDVWESTDGKFYCFHDKDVSRMTDGSGDINTMSSAQINALTIDAGYNIEEYPNLKIPTLQEYLTACKKYGSVPIIEIKVIARFSDFINVITSFGMIESVIFISASLWTINQIRATGNMSMCAYVRDAGTDIPSMLQAVLDIPNCTLDLGVPDGNLNKNAVDDFHSHNLPFFVWTCDNEAMAETYADYGIDIITSNEIIKFS